MINNLSYIYKVFGLKHQNYTATLRKLSLKQENNNQILVARPVIEAVYNYKYNGQEFEEEFGKNTYAYQWRDYDPAIARFNKIDRFAEKHQSMTPYHFNANNPMVYREIAGDSINVADLYTKNKNGEYVNKIQVKTFEFFTKTKTGKKYLSHFASKGQEIAGLVFESDGKYHKKGIDLNFGGNSSGTNDGDTGVGTNNDGKVDGNDRFQINVNIQGGGDFNVLSTIVHEVFIHVDRYVKDVLDNKKLDYSNIDKDLLDKRPSQRHHFQENRDVRKKRGSLYSTKGYNILKQGNAKYKVYANDRKIWNSMWEFIY